MRLTTGPVLTQMVRIQSAFHTDRRALFFVDGDMYNSHEKPKHTSEFASGFADGLSYAGVLHVEESYRLVISDETWAEEKKVWDEEPPLHFSDLDADDLEVIDDPY